jgi:hypothetical protein
MSTSIDEILSGDESRFFPDDGDETDYETLEFCFELIQLD